MARTFHGLSAAGGHLLLTEEHVLLTPWDMAATRKWLFKMLALAGAPAFVGKIDDLIEKSALLDPVAIPLTELTDVQALSRASLLSPPTARLVLHSGATL